MYNNQPQMNNYNQPQMNNYNQQPMMNNYNQPQMNYNNVPNNNVEVKKKSKLPLIIGGAILLVIIIVVIFLLLKGGSSSSMEEIVINSTFESDGNNYVLKSEDGQILLKDIARHGKFVVGATYVKNTSGEYGIINGSGKFIVPYGKYKDIEQINSWGSTYFGIYKVENEDQAFYIKSDGSILFKDDNDKKLKNTTHSYFYDSNNLVIITTQDKKMVYNNNGVLLKSFNLTGDKDKDEIGLYSSRSDYHDSILFDKTSYIFNSVKGIELISGKGIYTVGDSHKIEETITVLGKEKKNTIVRIIVQAFPPEKDIHYDNGIMYIYEDDKLLFKIEDKCNYARFESSDPDIIRCIDKDSKESYYDLNGKLTIK